MTKTYRRVPRHLRRLKQQWPVWAFLACWLPQVAGQDIASNKTIETVQVRHVGPELVSNQMVLSNIQTRSGDSFSSERINLDVKNLLGTGYFRNVDVSWEVKDSGIDLVYTVQGKPKLTEIRFEGNEEIKEKRLTKQVTSKVGEPIDEKTLFEDAKALREYYQKKGFQNTTVDYVPLINEDRGQGSVTFEIVEAPKVKIDKVLFKGNQAFSQRKLRKVIKTRNRWAFSWLTGSGIFKEDQFEEDKEKLRQHYWESGYVDFTINDLEFSYPEKNKMVIEITIDEGQQYLVGDLRIQGNEIFSTQELLFTETSDGPIERLGMYKGDLFTPAGLEENRSALEDLYESQGHLTPRNQGNTLIGEFKTANAEKAPSTSTTRSKKAKLPILKKSRSAATPRPKTKCYAGNWRWLQENPLTWSWPN